jgi:hypothetical protein
VAAGNVAFMENSWRGDVYEPVLRTITERWESERSEE